MALNCGSAVFASLAFLWEWFSLFYLIPSGAASTNAWKRSTGGQREQQKTSNQSGDYLQVRKALAQHHLGNPEMLLTRCSNSRWPSCYYWVIHICLDHISLCALDCTNNWQCILWSRVSLTHGRQYGLSHSLDSCCKPGYVDH